MVPGVASSNLVTRPMNKKVHRKMGFFIHAKGSDENWKFDKIAGENEKNEVQAVAIWKGAQRSWEYTIWSPAPLQIKTDFRMNI